MFILMSKKRARKVLLFIKIVSLALLLTFAVTELYRLYHQYDFNNKMWLKEDNPYGNPLKVQTKGIQVDKKEALLNSNNGNLLNRLKQDLEGFYKGENIKK